MINLYCCPIKLEQLLEQRAPQYISFELPLISHQFVFIYKKDMERNKSVQYWSIIAPYRADAM